MKPRLLLLHCIALLALSLLCSACTSSRLYEFHGRQADQAQNYAAALTNYTRAIESGDFSSDPSVSELYLSRAADKYELGDFKGAVEDYNEFLRWHPRFDQGLFKAYAVEVYFDKGSAEYAAGDFESAIADFDKVIRWRPRYTEAYYGRASARWKLNDLAGAAADFEAGLTNHTVNVEACLKRAEVRGFHGDYAGADADCDKAIRMQPQNAYARFCKGFFKLESKNYQQAWTNFSETIESSPNYAAAYQDRANAELRLDRSNEAVADYEKLISLTSSHGLDYVLLAKAMCFAGNPAGAVSNLNLAVAWSPKPAFIRRECGWVWDELGNSDAAQANFNKAIQLKPEDAESYTGSGIIAEEFSQPKLAVDNFRKAEQLNPSWIYLWYHVYLLRSGLGESAPALRELKEHMDSLPNTMTNEWSVQVGEYLTGKLSEHDFVSMATSSAPNSTVEREQLCEADYYTGMEHILAGDKTTATGLFQDCLATREFDFLEYTCARTELKALASH